MMRAGDTVERKTDQVSGLMGRTPLGFIEYHVSRTETRDLIYYGG